MKEQSTRRATDRRAQTIIDFYRKALEENGVTDIRAVAKVGHPAEEILNTAKEEGVEMIIIGSRGKEQLRIALWGV